MVRMTGEEMKDNLYWRASKENTSFAGHKNQLIDVAVWLVFSKHINYRLIV